MSTNIPMISRFLAIVGYINSAVSAASFLMAMFLLQKSSLFWSPQSIAEQETPVPIFKIATLEIANEYDLHRYLTILRIVIVILYVISRLPYMLSTNVHSFAYLFVKTSSKYCRNVTILMLTHMLINILGIVSILLSQICQLPKFLESLISTATILSNVICACLAIAYFLNSILAGIYAARGQYFKSFLIYPVIKV
jgi:hypothetical protein